MILVSQANAKTHVVDFSNVDLPYKYGKLQLIAHMSDGSECPITMDKEEFYENWAKKDDDGKALWEFVKEVCEK